MLKNGVNLVKNRQIQPISDFEAPVNTGFANGKVSIFGPILSETPSLCHDVHQQTFADTDFYFVGDSLEVRHVAHIIPITH